MIALASDFDGTLFNSEIAQPDIAKIKEFQNKGNLFGVCTGRSFNTLLGATENKVNYDFMILSTGAMICNNVNEIIYKKCIPIEIMKRIYNAYSDKYTIRIQANGNMYEISKGKTIDKLIEKCDSIDEINGDIYELCIDGGIDKNNIQQLAKELKNKYPEIESYQNINTIDIVYSGISKGSGIKFYKDYSKLKQIACIGDSYNDISMLKQADISFTFHESSEIVKASADYIVSTVAEAIDILENLNNKKYKSL